MHRLAILAALAACSDRETEQVEELAAKVCQCKTSKCAVDVLEQFPKNPPNASRRTQSAATDARNCLAKLIDAEKAPPPGTEEEAGSGSATAP